MSCNSATVTPNIVYDPSGNPPAACGSGVLQNPNAKLSGQLLVTLRKIALTYSDAITSGKIRFESNNAYVQFKKGQLLAAGKKGIRPQQSIIMTELQQFGCCQKAATVNAGGLNKYVPYTQP
jgi:hypothetical protein